MVDYCATKAAVLCLHEGNSASSPSESFAYGCAGLVQEVRQKHKAPNILFTSVHPGWVRTPLLEPYLQKLKTGDSAVLEPPQVADAIAGQILGCSGGQLCIPAETGWLTGVRGWPNWVQEYLRGGLSKVVLSGTE